MRVPEVTNLDLTMRARLHMSKRTTVRRIFVAEEFVIFLRNYILIKFLDLLICSRKFFIFKKFLDEEKCFVEYSSANTSSCVDGVDLLDRGCANPERDFPRNHNKPREHKCVRPTVQVSKRAKLSFWPEPRNHLAMVEQIPSKAWLSFSQVGRGIIKPL